MLENSIKEISAILSCFSGPTGLEVIDAEYVKLRYQCPIDDTEKTESFVVDNSKGEIIGVKILEFMEGNFKQK